MQGPLFKWIDMESFSIVFDKEPDGIGISDELDIYLMSFRVPCDVRQCLLRDPVEPDFDRRIKSSINATRMNLDIEVIASRELFAE